MTASRQQNQLAALTGYVWLVLKSRATPSQKEAIRQLEQWRSSNPNVRVRVLRAEERLLSADGLTRDGDRRRPIEILRPLDAHELYQRLHNVRSCVLSQGGIFVKRDPRRDPPTERDCIPLAEYVLHKATFAALEDPARAAADADRLLGSPCSDCSDLNDPRLLPFHVFGGGAKAAELLEEDGREKFRRDYHVRGGIWRSGAADWTRADSHAWHGAVGPQREALKVGDYLLPSGFHWDVTGRSSATTVANSSEVWELGRADYVNVYPSAYIRSGSRGSRKVWSAAR